MTIVWAIIFFGILIFVHELGHFVLAKLTGVKVLKFSLGFGPVIVGRKIGETEYVISAIPLGGYVKPLGEQPGEEMPEEDKPRAFNSQPVWKRTVIVLAGPVFNFVLAYIIFVVFLSLKYPVAIPDLDALMGNTVIENISEDSPAMRAGLKANDAIVAINGKAVNVWIEMQDVFLKNPGRELILQVKRGSELIDLKVTPDSIKEKDIKGNEIEFGTIGISKKEPAIIGSVTEESPAMRAGLKANDIIISIDGKDIDAWIGMREIFSGNPCRELILKVKRGSELIDLKITPDSIKEKDEHGMEIVVGRIGVLPKANVYFIESSILKAPLKGADAVYRYSIFILRAVGRLATGDIPAKQLGGPILIVDAAAKAASRGMPDYFYFIAIISINLAILNLLPVPVLDGGHLMFLSLEALRRKPLSEKAMKIASVTGISLLLVLITFVFYNDIMKIVVPWVMKVVVPWVQKILA
jgi:regulator of sigma E protease